MEYRTSDPEDGDYEDEEEEFESMHDYVQGLMENSGKTDITDTLLIMANVCDARALLNGHDKDSAEWYTRTSFMIRHALDVLSAASDVARPNSKLENPLLYYNMNTDTTH